jgi:hypothetical protein
MLPQQNFHVNSTAPGQLAGYTVQYFRALHRLLQCRPGESVSIEHIGDVAVNQPGGKIVLEEDKSSIAGKSSGRFVNESLENAPQLDPVFERVTDRCQPMSVCLVCRCPQWKKIVIGDVFQCKNDKSSKYSYQQS